MFSQFDSVMGNLYVTDVLSTSETVQLATCKPAIYQKALQIESSYCAKIINQ